MSDGKVLRGIRYDPSTGKRYPYTRRQYDYHGAGSLAAPRATGEEAGLNIEQTPTDEAAAVIEQYDAAAIMADLLSQFIITPGKLSLGFLPDVLTAIKITYNKAEGAGQDLFPVSQQAFAIDVRGSGSINPHASAEGSASIVPSVSFTRKIYRNRLVNCINVFFYLPQETNLAAALAKLTTKLGVAVTDMPIFKDEEVPLTLFGQQVSAQIKASSEAALGFTSDEDGTLTSETASFSWGNGFNQNNGVSERVEIIPPTLHASISLTSNEDTADVTVSAQANTVALQIEGVTQVDAITNEPTDVTATATATVKFNDLDTVPATTPVDIPKTGLYLADITSESDETYGVTKVHAVVVDMSQFA